MKLILQKLQHVKCKVSQLSHKHRAVHPLALRVSPLLTLKVCALQQQKQGALLAART